MGRWTGSPAPLTRHWFDFKTFAFRPYPNNKSKVESIEKKQEFPHNFSALPAKRQLHLLARGWRLRRTEGALGENSSDSIGQRIEPERRNAKEALRDNQQLFAQDAQLHLLPEKRGGKVSHGGHQDN